METAQIVALRVAGPSRPAVRVEGESVVIDRLRITDRALAAFVEQRAEDERGELAERALRIGLHALQDASTSLDVDFVRREFDELLERNATMNQRVAETLDQVLRQNFGDQEGRLPRTLERFLGDRGQLNRFVTDLFDESKRDSAIGRMRTLLGSYFDGDASRLAQLLDPTRLGSPLYQFRTEVSDAFEKLNVRLAAMEAAFATRGVERAHSSAKGTDFENLLDEMLTDVVRGTGDAVERTASATGDVIRSKKGDFLLTVDPQLCGGADLRVVIEAKDRQVSWRQIREELTEARRNRTAAVAVAVFTPAHAPSGVAPFDVRFGHVLCVVDPDAPDSATLGAAVRLARLYALASLAHRETEVDAGRVLLAVAAVRAELDAVRALKTQLTSIGRVATEVSSGLDRMREQVLARVADAEAQLQLGVVPEPSAAAA
ncbi:MAG: hypothetical protein WD830_01630 [Chloroflexota bacterium]